MSGTTDIRTAASALVALLGVWWFLLAQPVIAAQTRNILVLYSNDNALDFLIADDEPGLRDEAVRRGALAYLAKPFLGTALLAAIESAGGASTPM